jgi:hypothetical protein
MPLVATVHCLVFVCRFCEALFTGLAALFGLKGVTPMQSDLAVGSLPECERAVRFLSIGRRSNQFVTDLDAPICEGL